MTIKKVGVLGPGQMGTDIIQVFAQSDDDVTTAGWLGRKSGKGYYDYLSSD